MPLSFVYVILPTERNVFQYLFLLSLFLLNFVMLSFSFFIDAKLKYFIWPTWFYISEIFSLIKS